MISPSHRNLANPTLVCIPEVGEVRRGGPGGPLLDDGLSRLLLCCLNYPLYRLVHFPNLMGTSLCQDSICIGPEVLLGFHVYI